MSDGKIRHNQNINNENFGKVGRPTYGSDFTISRPSLFFYIMKDAYYFPHDSNAQNDEKILLLRSKWGFEGIGLYWCIVERLRDCKNYKYSSSAKAGLALGLNYPLEKLEVFLNTCIEIGLLTEEGGHFFSKSLINRMSKVDEIRNKLREAGRKGGLASQAQAALKPCSSIKEKESKVNKRKEKKIKENISIIISDLNSILNTSYKPNTPKTQELIIARMKEGAILDDFKTVHRKMAKAWGTDNKMRQFLRPQTLYSNKFESYLNRPDDLPIGSAGAKTFQAGQEWLKKRKEQNAK